MTFPLRLRRLRTDHGLTQTELAKRIGISRDTLSRYELGKLDPGSADICRVADYFGVSTDYLLGRSDRRQ